MAVAVQSFPAFSGPVAPFRSNKRLRATTNNSYKVAKYANTGAGQPSADTQMTIATQITTGSARTTVTKLSKRSRGYYDKFKIGANQTVDPVYPIPEVKYFDFNIGTLAVPVAVTSAGTISCINQIPQLGSNVTGRYGGQVSMKSNYYQFVVNLGTANVPAIVRHLLLYDLQSNLALPAAADILDDPTNAIVSAMNNNYRRRFIILASDRIQLSPQGNNIAFVKGFRKIQRYAEYTGGNGLANTGTLLSVLFSQYPAGTSAPLIYGVWRTRFQDS